MLYPSVLPTEAPKPEKWKWGAITEPQRQDPAGALLRRGEIAAQLQVFTLWETCLDLCPESNQVVYCGHNTGPPASGLCSVLACVEDPDAGWDG